MPVELNIFFMRIRNGIYVLVTIVGMSLLSSCALHSGTIGSSTSLSQANFKYVAHDLKGVSSATYVLGIGGIKRSLVDQAKRRMLESSPLKSNQAIANVNVNFKASNFGVYSRVKCIVTADVVEFTK